MEPSTRSEGDGSLRRDRAGSDPARAGPPRRLLPVRGVVVAQRIVSTCALALPLSPGRQARREAFRRGPRRRTSVSVREMIGRSLLEATRFDRTVRR